MSTSEVIPHRALLLVDFQVDFLSDRGRLPVDRSQVESVAASTRRAIDDAQRQGDLIVKIGNEFRRTALVMNALRRFAALADSPGAKWDPRFEVTGAPYLPKRTSDAFCNPDLDALLNEHHISDIALAGLKANACITATARSALSRGYRLELLTDAIACGSDRSRERALDRLERAGAVWVGVSGRRAPG
jgi:nicotinamidase-related amidase